MKKRSLLWAVVCTMMITSTACSSNTEVSETNAAVEAVVQGTEKQETEASVEEKSVDTAATVELESAGALGDYAVEIKEFELTKDYEGKPTIVVNYTFTNNAETENSAMVALLTQAFQNGVQLDTAIADSVNSEDSMKNLKTGASLDIQAAYVLTSETAPVEFEVSELISLSEEKLGKIFVLDEAGETVYPKAPEGAVKQDLGDYTVSIVDYQKAQDYEGSPAIVLNLGFTNNGTKTSSYMTALHCVAYQDGVQLETAIISDMDVDTGTSQMTNIRPGAGIPVAVAFVLSNETSPVEVEITEFISFSDDKLETTINIAE